MKTQINNLQSKHTKTVKSILIIFIVLAHILISISVFAQNVGIGSESFTPHESAMLEVKATDKGFLPPRMTSTERDEISNPTNGLTIYNTTTNCTNVFNGTNWTELCGTCIPQPDVANAGIDNLSVSGNTYTLSGNAPSHGNGLWTIEIGAGGSLDDVNDPSTTLTGVPGNLYVLRWTISTICGSTFDEVSIQFEPDYKRIFVTSTTHNGNLGGVNGADNICQNRADAAGLSGTYKAWVSGNNSSTSVNARFSKANQEYRLVDGTLIATDWADLTNGTIANPMNRDEFGYNIGGAAVWTNTNAAGNILNIDNYTCSNFTSSTGGTMGCSQCAAITGNTNLTTGGGWAVDPNMCLGGAGICYRSCDNSLRLICVEQ